MSRTIRSVSNAFNFDEYLKRKKKKVKSKSTKFSLKEAELIVRSVEHSQAIKDNDNYTGYKSKDY